jgi:hypothetical protein
MQKRLPAVNCRSKLELAFNISETVSVSIIKGCQKRQTLFGLMDTKSFLRIMIAREDILALCLKYLACYTVPAEVILFSVFSLVICIVSAEP